MLRFLVLLLTLTAVEASAQTVYNGRCAGNFAGVPLDGQLTVSYLTTYDTYSYNGVFFAPDGTRYDFEVVSNQNGGIGGGWVNGARHREARIEMRYSGSSFVIADLDNGGFGRFDCR